MMFVSARVRRSDVFLRHACVVDVSDRHLVQRYRIQWTKRRALEAMVCAPPPSACGSDDGGDGCGASQTSRVGSGNQASAVVVCPRTRAANADRLEEIRRRLESTTQLRPHVVLPPHALVAQELMDVMLRTTSCAGGKVAPPSGAAMSRRDPSVRRGAMAASARAQYELKRSPAVPAVAQAGPSAAVVLWKSAVRSITQRGRESSVPSGRASALSRGLELVTSVGARGAAAGASPRDLASWQGLPAFEGQVDRNGMWRASGSDADDSLEGGGRPWTRWQRSWRRRERSMRRSAGDACSRTSVPEH